MKKSKAQRAEERQAQIMTQFFGAMNFNMLKTLYRIFVYMRENVASFTAEEYNLLLTRLSAAGAIDIAKNKVAYTPAFARFLAKKDVFGSGKTFSDIVAEYCPEVYKVSLDAVVFFNLNSYKSLQYKSKKNFLHSVWLKITAGVLLLFILFINVITKGAWGSGLFEQSLILKVLYKVCTLVLLSYAALVSKRPADKNIIWSFAAIILLLNFLSITQIVFEVRVFSRIALLVLLVWTACAVFIRYKAHKNGEGDRTVSEIIIALVAISIVIDTLNYSPENWLAAIIAAAIMGAATAVFAYLKFLKNMPIRQKLTALAVLPVAFIISLFIILSLNYSLDYSRPQYIEAAIIKKRISTGARQPTTFEFTTEINGNKTVINVDSLTYHTYTENDTFTVCLYNGAFGMRYFIYEGG